MNVEKSERGFENLMHSSYPAKATGGGAPARLAGQSSAIGDYEDSWERPGSSFLWIGQQHHLNREEVDRFARHLLEWVATGKLNLES
jgi:hypothetical protein